MKGSERDGGDDCLPTAALAAHVPPTRRTAARSANGGRLASYAASGAVYPPSPTRLEREVEDPAKVALVSRPTHMLRYNCASLRMSRRAPNP